MVIHELNCMLLFDYKLEILKYNINCIRFVCALGSRLYEFFLKLITHSLHTVQWQSVAFSNCWTYSVQHSASL
jgi:hypothetical protein